jgi:acyl-CoA thioesterase-1
MATVSAGSFARVFCPLASDVTVTPGAQARVIVDDRDAGGAVIQIINAATTFAVSAGSSMQIEAINADAVYTEPAFTAAKVASVQRGIWAPTAIVFGDSFSARVNSSGVNYRQSDHSYWTWANIYLGCPMRLLGNYGVSGETTTEMLARTDEAIAAGAEWVFLQGGINDLSEGATVATVIANLQELADRFREGAKVVLLAIAPNKSPTSNAFKVMAVNAAMRAWASTVGNVIFVDTFTPLVNATDTTGDLAAGMSDDALHPSAKGAKAMGYAISQAIGKFMPTVPLLVSSAADSEAIDAGSNQILTNPLMSGSSGTVSGTGASGTIATGWSGGTDTGTVTNVWLHGQARADGVGVDQQVTITGAASGAVVNMRQTSGLTTKLAAGDTVYACGSITLSGMSDVSRVSPSITITDGGTGYVVHCLDNSDTTWDQSDLSFTWRTPNFTLQNIPTVFQFFIRIRFGTSGTGAAVLKSGRNAIYKVA